MTDRGDGPVGSLPSPCVRNCCLDGEDICLGCFRSISEIVRWSEASEQEKREILARCGIRHQQRQEKRG
jgi:predicted Fe-S protein YdhL (DUF1289 family)